MRRGILAAAFGTAVLCFAFGANGWAGGCGGCDGGSKDESGAEKKAGGCGGCGGGSKDGAAQQPRNPGTTLHMVHKVTATDGTVSYKVNKITIQPRRSPDGSVEEVVAPFLTEEEAKACIAQAEQKGKETKAATAKEAPPRLPSGDPSGQ